MVIRDVVPRKKAKSGLDLFRSEDLSARGTKGKLSRQIRDVLSTTDGRWMITVESISSLDWGTVSIKFASIRMNMQPRLHAPLTHSFTRWGGMWFSVPGSTGPRAAAVVV